MTCAHDNPQPRLAAAADSVPRRVLTRCRFAVFLAAALSSAWACTQNLLATESSNSASTGGGGSIGCLNTPCDPTRTPSTCCEGTRCATWGTWGLCVAVDAGTSGSDSGNPAAGPGQPCTDEAGCVFGFHCQRIGAYKLCMSYDGVTSSDGAACQLPTDCDSLNCKDNHCSAEGQPCKTKGDSCSSDEDCCSNSCGDDGRCRRGDCSTFGDSCDSDSDCCTDPPGVSSCVWVGNGMRCLASTCRAEADVCTSNKCCRGQCSASRCEVSGAPCLSQGQNCSASSHCCSKACNRGSTYQPACAKLDGCQPIGESCDDHVDCCSTLCSDGHCASNGGGACLSDGEICSDRCCSTQQCAFDWFGVSRCSSAPQGGCWPSGYACAFGLQCCSSSRCEKNTAGEFTCVPRP